MAKRFSSKSFFHSFNWLLIPIAFIIGIIPLMVRYRLVPTRLENEPFFDMTSETVDFFLKIKAEWFIGVSGLLALVVLFMLLKKGKKIKITTTFIPLAIYAFFVIISTLTSVYKPFPYSGLYAQFETIWVLLGYCLCAYYTYLIVNTMSDTKFIIAVLTISTIVMLLLGVAQAFSMDFFRSDLGLRFILPHDVYDEMHDSISFTFPIGLVYLTLYNPNYVGVYSSLLFPLFIMLIFTTKKVPLKILYGAIAIGLVLVLLGSGSRAGLIGIVFGIIMFAVVFNRQLIKRWFISLAIVVSFVLLIFFMNYYTEGTIIARIKSAFMVPKSEYALTNIETLDDRVKFTYKGNIFSLIFQYNEADSSFVLTPFDSSFQTVDYYQPDPNRAFFTISDSRFEGISFEAVRLSDEIVGFQLYVGEANYLFANLDNSYYYCTPYGKFIKMQNSETWEFLEQYGSLATNRGFIWARTIPLLSKNFIVGSGPDTFVFEFPNYDFLAMQNGGFNGMIMTKPHNMYLQIGVQTGTLSMIAVIVFYLLYFCSSLKLYVKKASYSVMSFIGIGILCGSASYMVVQVTNDSCLTVAPIYWCLMGLGLAVNQLVKEEK